MAVYGVGIKTEGKFSSSLNGKHTVVYTLWKNMLARCYSNVMKSHRPTYEGCSVEGDFLDFQKFAAWYESQALDKDIEYQLDKDLIFKGNKVYSADTCLLVPRKVNMFLCKSKASRGAYPIGVYLHRQTGKFVAQVGDSLAEVGTRKKRSGLFTTIDEAFAHYREFKKDIANELADLYEGKCDPRIITALRNYEVALDD